MDITSFLIWLTANTGRIKMDEENSGCMIGFALVVIGCAIGALKETGDGFSAAIFVMFALGIGFWVIRGMFGK